MVINGFELHEGCIFITNIICQQTMQIISTQKNHNVHNVLTPVLCFATIESIIFIFSFIYMRNNYNKCLVRSLKIDCLPGQNFDYHASLLNRYMIKQTRWKKLNTNMACAASKQGLKLNTVRFKELEFKLK